jgi:hypothetical protein
MIHLVFILGIGILIFRVIWLFFSFLEGIFIRAPAAPVEKPSSSIQTDTKKEAASSISTGSRKNIPPTSLPKARAETPPKKIDVKI